MPVAYLSLRGDGVAGETLSFTDELTLGRDEMKDRGYPDARLSRRHARVFVEADGQPWIEDLGSTNGTFVNGKRIRTYLIRTDFEAPSTRPLARPDDKTTG